jgi:hypothetical protein
MKNITLLSVLLASIGIANAVPTEINYQGRLTDGDGNPASGSKLFSLSLYDAATAGNELYTETIGSIAVDENGIYNFQFGANGTSTVAEAETLAVADGSSTIFNATPSTTPIAGTLSVTDGTYSWNEVDGNPGELATATTQLTNGFVVGYAVTNGGEGYTTAPVVTINGDGIGATATAEVTNGVVTAINVVVNGSGYTTATVSIAEPPAPFVVNYSAGELTFTYEAAPSAGVEITASYDANDTSIVGALSAADSHWLELSIDGDIQSPRERILSVPFAQVAGNAYAAVGELRRELDKIQRDLFYGEELSSIEFGTQLIGLTLQAEVINLINVPFDTSGSLWSSWYNLEAPTKIRTLRKLSGSGSHGIKIKYQDGTIHTLLNFINGNININPYPDKILTAISLNKGYNSSSNLSMGLYRDDINPESLIQLQSLSYRPNKVFLNNISASGFADSDDFQILLRGVAGDLLLTQGTTTIPNEIGDLLNIVIRIIPEPNLIGTNLPIINSLRIRFD